jgi:hypothetical protein
MNKELDKKLVENYPKIFADRHKSAQETCMCWGFECDSGWYNLIDSLCSSIQHHLNCKPAVPQVVVDQVKEKFGTLCFYFHGGDDYIHGLVDMACRLTKSICEICGNPGKIKNDGWIKVRCDNCG